MKTYHFLAGLPRSGNTLLSSILNQNKNIFSSPISPINSIIWNYFETINTNENALKYSDRERFDSLGKKLIDNFYFDVDKPVIIDREKCWATPANFNLIKSYVTSTPKVIFTVRPIIDVLTSFITILPERSFIDIEMEENGWWSKNHLSINDNRCDYLMRPFGQIDKITTSANIILNPEHKDCFCVIEYDEIVNNPKETMSKIYDFLELPYYQHDFNNIKKVEDDVDEAYGHPKDLHKIRPKINKISKRPEDVLSDYVLNKYSNLEWWRK